MLRNRSITWCTCAVVFSLFLSGCSNNAPVPYGGIAAAQQLMPNAGDTTGRVPYLYATQVDWRRYDSLYLEPVGLYSGSDSQFGSVDIASQTMLAHEMDKTFRDVLKTHFSLTDSPGPKTLRLQVTLTGVTKNTPYLAPASRFDPGLAPYNLIQAYRDRQGTFTGSVSYMVAVYDGANSKLLESYISQQYPKALNLASTHGAFTAARIGMKIGAEDLSKRLTCAEPTAKS